MSHQQKKKKQPLCLSLAATDISLPSASGSYLVGVPAVALLWQRGTFGKTLEQLLRKVDLQLAGLIWSEGEWCGRIGA